MATKHPLGLLLPLLLPRNTLPFVVTLLAGIITFDERGNRLNARSLWEPVFVFLARASFHSIWNLDRQWESNIKQHILFLDVEFFRQWPLSPNRWQLIKHWVPEDVKVFAGTIDELKSACINASPIYREYPACQGWPGKQTPRRWLYPDPEDSYKSFSQFWKQVKKHVEL